MSGIYTGGRVGVAYWQGMHTPPRGWARATLSIKQTVYNFTGFKCAAEYFFYRIDTKFRAGAKLLLYLEH